MGSSTIAVVASLTRSLTNFRLELLKKMISEGHKVVAFAPENDVDVIKTLNEIGVTFVQIPMARASFNPFGDLQTLYFLWRQFRSLRPDVVLPYTMKPIVYGCLAARFAGVRRRYALVTGLGHVFGDTQPKGHAALVRTISVRLCRFALKDAQKVFVYNETDKEDILNYRMVGDTTPLIMVPGSGVDLEHYRRSPAPEDPPVFLLIARLLRDKGTLVFVEAARELKSRYPHVQFQLLGPFDPNPTGISKAEVASWMEEGVVEYLGETRDVRPYLSKCSVYVLPSYYREGVPRSILEAMATGRGIITTDNPGCRDTVIEGKNGFIVPPRRSSELVVAMEKMIMNPELIGQMGAAAHELASSRYDVHAVNQLLLGEIGLLRSEPGEFADT